MTQIFGLYGRYKCPHCQVVFVADQTCTDYVHDCDSGNNALDKEDRWAPEKGPFVGTANRLQGKDVDTQNFKGDFDSVTERGTRAVTHVTRDRFVHIDLKTMRVGKND